MTLVQNETQQHSAALKSAGQSPIGLLPLNNHSTYITSCFLPFGVFATLSYNIPREKGKLQWEQADTNGSIIPSKSVKSDLCRTWRSSASATRCLPRPGAFWTPPKRTKNPCGVVRLVYASHGRGLLLEARQRVGRLGNSHYRNSQKRRKKFFVVHCIPLHTLFCPPYSLSQDSNRKERKEPWI